MIFPIWGWARKVKELDLVIINGLAISLPNKKPFISKKVPHPPLYYFGRGLGLMGCLLLALTFGCDRKEAESTAPPPEVLVSEVIQKDVPIYGEWVGTTVGYVDAQIRARIQGYLLSRKYTEGS